MRAIPTLAVLVALLLCSSAPLTAAAAAANTDSQAILAQQQEIRAKATARQDRYKDMEETRRNELFAHQDRVTRLLAGTTQTTELPERDQIELFNALEAIAAIVNRAEDERMICERHKLVGSNRPQTLCKTVAQRRAERERDVDSMSRRDQQCMDGWNSDFCRN